MNVAVTGATGFIGYRLVEKLAKKDYKVKILIRKPADKKRFEGLNVTSVVGDLLQKNSLSQFSKGVEVVFNCAAALPYHNLSEKGYWNTNVNGIKNLLEVCKKNKVKRLIHLSSVGVYGETTREAVDEDSPFNTKDDYSKTKAEGERLLKSEIGNGNLQITIVRPTICYGPGDTRPGFLDLFKLVERGMFVPVGSGNNYFHTIYIDNLIDALYLALKNKNAVNNDFIIGDSPCPKMKKVIESIYSACGKKTPRFYMPVPLAYLVSFALTFLSKIFSFRNPLPSKRVTFITRNRRFSIKKAEEYLHYRPRVSLKEGMAETHAWYKKEGFL